MEQNSKQTESAAPVGSGAVLDHKHIIEVWFPGEGNSHNDCYRIGKGGITKIEMVNTFHGDRDENWIVVEQGEITRKINPRKTTEIVWSNI